VQPYSFTRRKELEKYGVCFANRPPTTAKSQKRTRLVPLYFAAGGEETQEDAKAFYYIGFMKAVVCEGLVPSQ
jgi:hypothetical protein